MKATDLQPEDQGELRFMCAKHPSLEVHVSKDGTTVEWTRGEAAWVQCPTTAHLHSGLYRVTFDTVLKGDQIGVGFLLDGAKAGPDWGFFGYLGASGTAWAYDPWTGDVVTATRSIESGLPTFDRACDAGTVVLELHLPRAGPGSAIFLVDGKASRAIELPESSVVVPAACLLQVGQSCTVSALAL